MSAWRLRLIVAVLLLSLAGVTRATERDLRTPRTPWTDVAPEDRQVLAPLAGEWDRLPGYQQKRLQSAAKQYPKMQPIQRERFQERIHTWAAMTPEQRKAARETFKGMKKLSPEKQHELKERWLKKREAQEAAGGKPQ